MKCSKLWGPLHRSSWFSRALVEKQLWVHLPIDVSVIYCCITKYINTRWFKTTPIYYVSWFCGLNWLFFCHLSRTHSCGYQRPQTLLALSFNYSYSYSSLWVFISLFSPSLGITTSCGSPLMPDSECFTILISTLSPCPHLYEQPFHFILLNSSFKCAICFLQGLWIIYIWML